MSCDRIYRKAPTMETGWGFVLLQIVTYKKSPRAIIRGLSCSQIVGNLIKVRVQYGEPYWTRTVESGDSL
jgi:hypothetical protein